MKSDFVEEELFIKIFPYMTMENALAVSTSLQTGMRIGDVVSLKRSNINKKGNVISFTAQKTGKKAEISISRELCDRLCRNSGKKYVFEGKNVNKHRTRQAVWVDVKKACEKVGITENLTPHSARKNYAVNLLRKTGSLSDVQRALQHSNADVTKLYAYADRKSFVIDDEVREELKNLFREVLLDLLPCCRCSKNQP